MDDDITEAVLSEDTYRQARATVRQTFSAHVERKVAVAIVTLVLVVPLWPLIALRQELIRSLEGSATYTLSLGVLALYGVGLAFGTALLLLLQYRRIQTSQLGSKQARKLLRIEDLLTWFLLLGTAFVVLSAGTATVGVLSPATIERLYGANVVVYRPTETIPLDIRYVSVLGGVLGGVLSVLLLWIRPDTRRD